MNKILLSVLLLAITHAYGGVVMQQTFTPEFLANNAVFPNGSATLGSDSNGSFLDLPTTSQVHTKLMEISLLAANTLPTNIPTTISLSLNIERRSGDNDLSIFLTDGVDGVGIMRFDNSGGGMHPVQDSVADINNNGTGSATFGSFSMPASDLYGIEWVLGTSTTVEGTMSGQTTGVLNAPRTINRDAALNFMLMNNNAGELYRIRSMAVTISNDAPAIPEPHSLVLLCGALGIMGLFSLQRNRKKGK